MNSIKRIKSANCEHRVPAVNADTKEEEKSRAEDAIHSSLTICSLPREIVFSILVRLPARFLYEVTRRVCREWNHMIHTRNFIDTHLMHSTSGLLIQECKGRDTVFVSMHEGRLEISKLDYIVPEGRLWSSCNGLMLAIDFKKNLPYVTNITTEQKIYLPQFCRNYPLFGSGLLYVKATMEYKVFLVYDSAEPIDDCLCAILTIGVDKVWRHVDTEHLPQTVSLALSWSSPMYLGGFLAWFDEECVVAFNVETETIRQYPVPQGYCKTHKEYLAMGSNISFVSCCNEFSWEVWEMEMETGEWTKCMNIDLEAQRCRLERLISTEICPLKRCAKFKYCTSNCSLEPVGWLKPREVLLFRVWCLLNLCIVYDVQTQEIHLFELDTKYYSHTYQVHVNSLVSLEGWGI